MATGFDGIVSGLQTSQLIDAIVGAAASPRIVMENQLADFQEKSSKVSEVVSRFRALSTTIDDFNEVDEVEASSVTVADGTQFDATVDGDAVKGSYDIQVVSLARSTVLGSDGFADPFSTGVLGTGDLTVNLGGAPVGTVTLDGTNNSLSGLATELDAIDGIEAYVLDTGAATNPYRLVVQGANTGLANAVTLDDSGLTGGTPLNLVEEVAADDAEVTLNNISVFSDDNQVVDAVPGLTLDLKAEGTTTDRVTIEADLETISAGVQSIVDGFNDIVTYFDTQSFFNADTGNRGPLTGEPSVSRAIDTLGTSFSTEYTGLTGSFTTLAQVGFSTNRDGTLDFDSAAFEEAYAADRESVLELFTDPNGPLAAVQALIDDTYVDSEEGVLVLRKESLESSVQSTEERIERFDAYIESYTQRLRDRFTAMEVNLGRIQAQSTQLAAISGSLPSS